MRDRDVQTHRHSDTQTCTQTHRHTVTQTQTHRHSLTCAANASRAVDDDRLGGGVDIATHSIAQFEDLAGRGWHTMVGPPNEPVVTQTVLLRVYKCVCVSVGVSEY